MSYIVLPAIRSKIGDWNFYSSVLSFNQINQLIKNPDEVHERQHLSDWIQREAIDIHSEEIAEYIISNEQRFLGSLIIGVYDGHPEWSPLNVSFKHDYLEISDEQKEGLDGKLGFLSLTGNENLFAIDGQHRVSGIKKALENAEFTDTICSDEVGAIFVSHDASTQEGKERTRRLFTTVNKKAQRVSKSAIIALDEDNGFAIITRKLIDTHWLFEDEREHISYTSAGSIVPENETLITSVVGLYEIIKDLYIGNKKVFETKRPNSEDIDYHFNICNDFFNILLDKYTEYHSVFVNERENASSFRNLLLFRPIGQRVFAKATQVLLLRGKTLDESITILLNANMNLNTTDWHHILWNPIDSKMINNKIVFAETKLLNLINENARTNTNQTKLDSYLLEIANQ